MILYIKENPPDEGNRMFPVTGLPFTVGNQPSCDGTIDTPYVSRRHFMLEEAGDSILLKDLHSTNGTRVNGTEVSEQILFDGDSISIGDLTLKFMRYVIPTPLLSLGEEPAGGSFRFSNALRMIKNSGLIPSFTTEKRQAPAEGVAPSARIQQQLTIINEISRELIGINDLPEYYSTTGKLILETFGADRCVVFIREEEELFPVAMENATECTHLKLGISNSILRRVLKEGLALMVGEEKDFTESMIEYGITSIICAPMLNNEGNVTGVIYLDNLSKFEPFTRDELTLLVSLSNFCALCQERIKASNNLARELAIRGKLARYHSPKIIDLIVRKQVASYVTEEKEATILFADIVKFTALTEGLPARKLVGILNEYFSAMTEVIFFHNGTLDKYIGDALMAVFGIPIPSSEDARNAIETALDMLDALRELNKNKPPEHRFDIRIGINTGQIISGDIGSLTRMDYTAIGDTVNVASRLESQVATPMQIAAGERTYEICKDDFRFEDLGNCRVKGKLATVKAYRILGRT